MTSTMNDRLVLYIEECYYENSKMNADTRCYILYDEVEQEYFITGNRLSLSREVYGDFNFYCKSRENLLNYLSIILNTGETVLNYGLFNYKGLFDNNNMVDFHILNESRDDNCEIAFYFEGDYSFRRMKKLLSTLKYVRY
jgi:hypothetical protein